MVGAQYQDTSLTQGLTWGLAGYGDLAQRRLVEALSRPPNRLAAVWGRDSKRAQVFAERFGVPHAAGSLEALVQDVDAVYVAVPPVAHVPVALAAVEAGRHVLIEKPLSPTFDGYETLAALVAEKGGKAAIAYYRRFAPAVRRLRQILIAAELGSIISVDLLCSRSFNPVPGDKAWRLDPAIAGGGVAADIGCHRLDLLCWLFGVGRLVDARIQCFSAGTTERIADMTIAFPSGLTARCRFSWNEILADRLVIHGEYGTVTLNPLDKGRLVIETPHEKKIFNDPPSANLHIDLVAAFGRWVHGEEEPICTLFEARRVDELLEAAYGEL